MLMFFIGVLFGIVFTLLVGKWVSEHIYFVNSEDGEEDGEHERSDKDSGDVDGSV